MMTVTMPVLPMMTVMVPMMPITGMMILRVVTALMTMMPVLIMPISPQRAQAQKELQKWSLVEVAVGREFA